MTGLDLQVPLILNVRAPPSSCSSLDLENFRGVEDDVDAATPVDTQNAPTGVWKSRTEREIPTASTSITVLRKRKRTKNKDSSYQLSTRSDQLQSRTYRCWCR